MSHPVVQSVRDDLLSTPVVTLVGLVRVPGTAVDETDFVDPTPAGPPPSRRRRGPSSTCPCFAKDDPLGTRTLVPNVIIFTREPQYVVPDGRRRVCTAHRPVSFQVSGNVFHTFTLVDKEMFYSVKEVYRRDVFVKVKFKLKPKSRDIYKP